MVKGLRWSFSGWITKFCSLLFLLIELIANGDENAIQNRKKLICFEVDNENRLSDEVFNFAMNLNKFYGVDYDALILHDEKFRKSSEFRKFRDEFDNKSMVSFDYTAETKNLVASSKCDLLFIVKSGSIDSSPRLTDAISEYVPTVVLATEMLQSHSKLVKLLAVNSHLIDESGELVGENYPLLPLIVPTPPLFSRKLMQSVLNLRSKLAVSDNSTVICGLGHSDSAYSLAAVETVIKLVLGNRRKVEFIFLGFNPFAKHMTHSSFMFNNKGMRKAFGIHILQQQQGREGEDELKESVLGLCDAMFYGDDTGETFGASTIGAFSVRNKPVLVYVNTEAMMPLSHAEHLRILMDDGFYCVSVEACVGVMDDWLANGIPADKDYTAAYSKYSPEKVMKQFKSLVLDLVFSPRSTRNEVEVELNHHAVQQKKSQQFQIPCTTCSIKCSSSLLCEPDAQCDAYINTFAPPSPLICSFKHLHFTDDANYHEIDETLQARFIPIGFAVHADDIWQGVDCIPEKAFQFSKVDPANRSTYIYSYGDEPLYRRNMAHSLFAHTQRKDGNDCMRHYEIIAAGAMPYFNGLEDVPAHILPFIPRELLIAGKSLADESRYMYDSLNRTRQIHEHKFDFKGYARTTCCLSRFARRYLTSAALARYVLSFTRIRDFELRMQSGGSKPKVLLIMPEEEGRYFDYLSFALFHGLRSVLGAEHVKVYPLDPILFEVEPSELDPFRQLRERRVWGLGYSWAHRVRKHPSDLDAKYSTRDGIISTIIAHNWDVIIYGTIHRSMPLWDLVREHYYHDDDQLQQQKDRLVFLDGEDFELDEHAVLEANYRALQWPPFNVHWRELLRSGLYFKRELSDTCPLYSSRQSYVLEP